MMTIASVSPEREFSAVGATIPSLDERRWVATNTEMFDDETCDLRQSSSDDCAVTMLVRALEAQQARWKLFCRFSGYLQCRLRIAPFELLVINSSERREVTASSSLASRLRISKIL